MSTVADVDLAALALRKDFQSSARSVLAFVRQELELDMALVSRRVDAHYVVLVADDDRYDVHDGDVLVWADTFCARMADGRAPMIAPRIDDVPAFVEARALQGTDMECYVAVPIVGNDGQVIGSLCGASAERKDARFAAKLPVVRLFGELLGAMLHQERELAAAVREAERASLYAHTDALTALGNRRHWDTMLATEAERFRRYASPYSVAIIDLDGLKDVNDRQGHAAGDELICLTAEVLRASVRPSDTLVRLGGDEFGILAVECDEAGATALVARLKHAFATAGLRASVGAAVAEPGHDSAHTWAAADAAMYTSKREADSLVSSL